MHIDQFLPEAQKLIEERLSQLVAKNEEPLLASARYSLLASAKRLRPSLLLATAVSYGIEMDIALNPACALEMIHTYSLIHDDLPCMDDDDLRRGKPTLHKVVPQWQALLTGDYLLTYAFEILSTAPQLKDSQKIALIQIFSKESGSNGMIGGQMIDLLSENKSISWTLLEEMHTKKTASLIIAALESGAILGGACSKDLDLLKQIGQKIGIAFQLVDDLLDEEGTTEQLGKPAGSDARHKKATAISILGIEKTKEMLTDLRSTIEDLCSQLSCNPSLLKNLFEQMIHRFK